MPPCAFVPRKGNALGVVIGIITIRCGLRRGASCYDWSICDVGAVGEYQHANQLHIHHHADDQRPCRTALPACEVSSDTLNSESSAFDLLLPEHEHAHA